MTLTDGLAILVMGCYRSIIVVGAGRIDPRSSLVTLAELVWARLGQLEVGVTGASVTGGRLVSERVWADGCMFLRHDSHRSHRGTGYVTHSLREENQLLAQIS